MKVIHLFLTSLMKILELFYTLLIGIMVILSFIDLLVPKNIGKFQFTNESYVNLFKIIFVVFILLWYFTLCHNNLLTNIRFAISQNSLSLRFCWEGCNLLTCVGKEKKVCRMICQDNINQKHSLIKLAL